MDEIVEVPAFVMNGDEIVEVFYSKWRELDPTVGKWGMAEPTAFDLRKEADRIVFELPHGCFVGHLSMGQGTVSLDPTPGVRTSLPLYQCQRPSSLVHEDVSQESSARP